MKALNQFCPFLGSLFNKVKMQLQKIQSQHLLQINLVIIFKSSCRLSSVLNFNDKLPLNPKYGVIYKYTCSRCNSTSQRRPNTILARRFAKHQGRSPLTGNLVEGIGSTSVIDHMLTCNTSVSFSNFNILDKKRNSRALKMKKAQTTSMIDFKCLRTIFPS